MFDLATRMSLAQIAGALVLIAAVVVLYFAKIEPKSSKKKKR